MIARQGDVIIKSIEPQEARRNVKHHRRQIIRKGEATGHNHRLIGDFNILEMGRMVSVPQLKRLDDGGYAEVMKKVPMGFQKVIEVLRPSKLVHEEHGEITLEPGVYTEKAEQEQDYAKDEVRHAID